MRWIRESAFVHEGKKRVKGHEKKIREGKKSRCM